MTQKSQKTTTGRSSVSKQRGQKSGAARPQRSSKAPRATRTASHASRSASTRAGKSRPAAPKNVATKKPSTKHAKRSQTGRSSSAKHGSTLGHVVLSGGSSSGATSGYHHAVTIDEKTRNVKKQGGSPKSAGSRSFFQRHRGIVIAAVAVVVIALGLVIDGALTQDRIYAGVRIGDVDVGGRTQNEAAALVAESYGDAVVGAQAVVFASADEAAQFETDGVLSERARDDQWSDIVTASDNGLLWIADAETLGLTLPSEALAREAFAVGRDAGGLPQRIAALFGGYDVALRADYRKSAMEALTANIASSAGTVRRECSVDVNEEGVASAASGRDGYYVDRSAFETSLNDAIFHADRVGVGILAVPEYGEITTSDAQATHLADQINAVLDHRLVFTYGDARIEPTRAEIGSWVRVSAYDPDTGAWGTGNGLKAQLDADAAERYLAAQVHPLIKDDYHLTFVAEDSGIDVEPSAGAPLPAIDRTIAALNDDYFNLCARPEGSGEPESAATEYPNTIEVGIPQTQAPARLSFDEALASGLVIDISSYTTNYLASNANRVTNIHIAADLLDDSITNPNETWSFLGLMGDPDADLGFVGAGAIIGNEHQDAVGGGICQVATTVFNAVYEAGYPITQRRNHSLYMSNYPDGRDAAVAYPTLDLQWKNDTDSGVLMRTSYTDSSVTITLYGVDPGYEVSTEVGPWLEGRAYSSVTKYDSSLAPGQTYIESYGSNGRIINVWRTVTDENGDVKSEDRFYSEYGPVDQVTRVGG